MRLPSVSGSAAAKAFHRAGWRASRQHGSHLILVKEGREEILSVPLHDHLAKGTLRSLISAARMTVDEFVALL